jgi:hypothetical protein
VGLTGHEQDSALIHGRGSQSPHGVHRVWGAQRISRYRAPVRRLASRDLVVTARESFRQDVESLPDPLNPESGARTPMTVLAYEHRGEVSCSNRPRS